jgi:hypothetical protein
MSRHRAVQFASLVCGVLVALSARAEDGPPPELKSVLPETAVTAPPTRWTRWAERPLTIAAVGGFATPIGNGGGLVELSPVPWLVVGAGGGASTDGPQLAIATRVRFPISDSVMLGAGLGLSRGPYTWETHGGGCGGFGGTCSTATRHWDQALRANLELAFEGMIPPKDDGWRWRLFGGLGRVVNQDAGGACQQSVGYEPSFFGAGRAIAAPSCDGAGRAVLYVGASLGYAFRL